MLILLFLFGFWPIGSLLCQQQNDGSLLIAAAADMAPLETGLAQGFRQVTGQQLTFVLAASGMLARQIQQGAPYDVYLCANQRFVQDLVKSGDILADSVTIYAYGRIALWSKSGEVRSLSDLLDKSMLHLAIANPAHAPYGMAAREALKNRGLWDALQPKLIYGQNVRQALEFAESGNADAVVTSWTLVFNKGGVLLPEKWHQPIRQTGGVVKSSRHRDLAGQFLEFLTGEPGRRLLRDHGLLPPTPSGVPGRKRP
jgi:molybdate transport system substrate-binding protein